MKKNIVVIILAAGKGERMKSGLAKVMHPVCARPMLGYVFDLIQGLKAEETVVVLGHKHEEVSRIVPKGIKVAIQKELKGTADAVKQALRPLRNFKGAILVLYGDNPLLTKETINKLLKHHIDSNPAATLLTAVVDKPAGYGRILRDKYSSLCGIAEEKESDEFQKEIKEINTGIACFNKDDLSFALSRIKPNNRKKEYYLTDAVEILYKNGRLIESVNLSMAEEALGVNSRVDLAKANKIMQKRINKIFMEAGVTLVSPASTHIAYGAKIGRDTVIYPFTVIEKDVKIGKHCSVGPFAHLREGTRLEDDVLAGNFLEITRSKLGSKTLIKHFAYIGDANIGRRANVGAGTVTANFDGKSKSKVVIQDDAFIGSDTVLIAPVKVGKKAKTGAGSVVIKNNNIPAGKIVAGVPAKLITLKKR